MTECISSAAGVDCDEAEYEWMYTEANMHKDPKKPYRIPLCQDCTAYWRKTTDKPYKIRNIRRSE